MASVKENVSNGNVSNGTESQEQEWHHGTEDAASHQRAQRPFDSPKWAVLGEAARPLSSKENVSGRPVPLGDECYSTPARVKAEGNSCCELSEEQRRKSVDFATITAADFGITPESFVNGSTAKSPAALKLRRRSAIGARGSPENNSLIQYLAQQKSNRPKEAFPQASPCQFSRSLKSKMDIFQRTFKSVQEAEGKKSFSGLSQGSDAFQEEGCLAQNKALVTKEHGLDQKSEALMSDCNGADLKENLKQNLTSGSKSGRRVCTILSLQQDVTELAAVSKERTYKQDNPTEYLKDVLIRDTLETSYDFHADRISKEVRSDVVSDQSRKKVNFAEEPMVEIYDESKPPVTPQQIRSALFSECTQSGSQLRSVLKKTPVRQLMDCTKEYSNSTVHRGGSEPFTVSDHICEALQTEKTEQYSLKRAKKKKVTFGEDLSPEIFDETLPANTPLRKGSTPVCHSGSERDSPFTRAGLTEEPLTQPNFDCSDDCFEPPQELQEGCVSEKLLPVENTKEAEADKSDMRTTRCSTKRKYSTISEGTDCSISRTASAKNAKDPKNPRRNELQRPKNVTISAAKKKQKAKRTIFGKRRKRKVKKSLYGERKMASKKPLLSPILEIPEVFSSASSPNSPKAIARFLDHSTPEDVYNDAQQEQVTENMREKIIPVVHVYPSSKDLDIVEEGSPSNTVFQFPNVVPDRNGVLNTYDCFQQAEETACLKEKTESDCLIEHEKLQGDFPKEEWPTGLEFPNQKDTDVHEILQRTECPPKRSSRSRPLGRRSSTLYIPPIEKSHFETTGEDLQVSSFNIEEVLSAPQPKSNSLRKPLRRKSSMSSETSRVRRSMRLQKGAEIEGLAWIEVTNEILQNPSLLAPACRARGRISTSVLTESENNHHREENLIQFSASGKENNEFVCVAGGPCRRRRKSICVSAPQETRTWSQTRKRSITNSVYRRDSSNQIHSEEMKVPLANSITT